MNRMGTTARAPAEQGPRSLSRTELARIYAPDLTDGGARKRLKKWLDDRPDIMAELQGTGFRESQRVLTPRQVEIVMKGFWSSWEDV